MAVVQDTYFIPNDISTGLATGLYRRCGSIIRYNEGNKKGQIYKHLKPIKNIENNSKRLFQFAKNLKTICIFASIIAFASAFIFCLKNKEPKELKEFRYLLKRYIEAIRTATLTEDIINDLQASIRALKNSHKYEKIKIELTTNEIEVLVNRIYNYTIKFAENNNYEMENSLNYKEDLILNLESYLETQRKIFEFAA